MILEHEVQPDAISWQNKLEVLQWLGQDRLVVFSSSLIFLSSSFQVSLPALASGYISRKTGQWADVLRVARECSEMAQADAVFPAIGAMAKQLVEDPVAIHSGLVHALGALEQTTPQALGVR